MSVSLLSDGDTLNGLQLSFELFGDTLGATS
jgi:hypothetical protein